MSVVANVAINVDASKALQQIKGFDSAVSGLGGTAKGLSGQLGELAAKLGIAAGAAVAFNKSFDAIRGMDQAVAKVKTLGVNTDELVPKLAAVSRELKGQVSTAELTAAAYDVASAGFANAAENADILKAASLGAVGGFSDVNTVADAATSILNAYGRSAGDAALIVDQLVQTQNDGKTTVDEYAKALGRIIPTASAAGIGVEEVNAGVATLTAKGIQTNEAVTGLNQAIASIIKPTSEAEKMASALGIEFNAAALQSKGLGGVLGDVQKVTGGNVEQMAQLFGSVEALKAVLGLTSDDLGVFNKNLKNQGDASGVAEKAADKMANTIDGAFKRISTTFENMLTETDGIGGSIATILNGVAFVVEGLSTAFNLLPGPIRTVVVGFGLLALGITAVAIPLGIVLPLLKALAALKIGATIAGWLGAIGPAIIGIKAAFAGLLAWIGGTLIPGLLAFFSGPVGWTVLAVAAVVAMCIYFREPIGKFFVWLGEAITNGLKALWAWGEPIRKFWVDVWEGVKGIVSKWFDWVKGAVEWGLKAAYAVAYQVWVQPWINLWDKVLREPVTKAWEWLKGVWGGISKWWTANVTGPIGKAWENLTQLLPKAMQNVAKSIKGVFDGIVNGIKSAIRNVLQFVASNINRIGAQVNRLIGAFNRLPGPDIPFVPTLSVPQFAKGGVVSGPTLAMVGEGGEPEYIIPQSKMAQASANYLNGARGGAVIPAFANGGFVGGNAQINVTTGPVMQQGGQQYVTLADLEKAMRKTADGVYASLRTPAGRYAVGVR